MRLIGTGFAAGIIVLGLTGCGTAEPKRVPKVVGQRLDLAQHRLDDAGIQYETLGAGVFGVVIRSNWRVCSQTPKPGARAKKVELVVAHSCTRLGVAPDVTGENLEDAKERLGELGLAYDVTPEDDDDEPLVDHLWTVCSQDPEPGAKAGRVVLYVDRTCWDD
jgi:beta-lactam-binding protein with PASTA domain